jgi:hypothetical protein
LLWRRYFTFGGTELPLPLLAAVICRELGWTYQEFVSQPVWFVPIIIKLMNEEAVQAKKKN